MSFWRLQAYWTRQKQARPEPAWQRGELPTPAPVPVLCELGGLLGVSEHRCPPLLHQARIKGRNSPLALVRGSSLMLGNGSCSLGPPWGWGVDPKENGALAAEGRGRAGLSLSLDSPSLSFLSLFS